MDKIPLEDQRVIDELVEFWQTCHEPPNLATHIGELFSSQGSSIVCAVFFKRVYEDLRTYRRSQYHASSASGFKQSLEVEYSQRTQIHTERVARRKMLSERRARIGAKKREKDKIRAKTDFDALGREMTEVAPREELIELGRERAALVLYTGVSDSYQSHCWHCGEHISSTVNARCPKCKWYICSCGACGCGK